MHRVVAKLEQIFSRVNRDQESSKNTLTGQSATQGPTTNLFHYISAPPTKRAT